MQRRSQKNFIFKHIIYISYLACSHIDRSGLIPTPPPISRILCGSKTKEKYITTFREGRVIELFITLVPKVL